MTARHLGICLLCGYDHDDRAPCVTSSEDHDDAPFRFVSQRWRLDVRATDAGALALTLHTPLGHLPPRFNVDNTLPVGVQLSVVSSGVVRVPAGVDADELAANVAVSWNMKHPVGTRVAFWLGGLSGEPDGESTTDDAAKVATVGGEPVACVSVAGVGLLRLGYLRVVQGPEGDSDA